MKEQIPIPIRLAGFAFVLIAVFAAAALAGKALDPSAPARTEHDDERAAASSHGSSTTHGSSGHAESAESAAAGSLTLVLLDTPSAPGKRGPMRFGIRRPDGATLRDFDIEHTRRMHLVVVRKDLSTFQHLHPEQAADGTWSTPITLGEPGAYRVFADFTSGGDRTTLHGDLTIAGGRRTLPLPPPATTAAAGGYRVGLRAGHARAGRQADLRFRVTRDGETIVPEPYLGALGHLVALRDGDLEFLHVHPDEDELRFSARFPTAGSYRLFLQFDAGGRVHTAPFTVAVER